MNHTTLKKLNEEYAEKVIKNCLPKREKNDIPLASTLKNLAKFTNFNYDLIDIDISLRNSIVFLSHNFTQAGIKLENNIIFDSLVYDMMGYHLDAYKKLNTIYTCLASNNYNLTDSLHKSLFKLLSDYYDIESQLRTYKLNEKNICKSLNNYHGCILWKQEDLLNKIRPNLISLGFETSIPALKKEFGLSAPSSPASEEQDDGFGEL